jgi:hypothetical protein
MRIERARQWRLDSLLVPNTTPKLWNLVPLWNRSRAIQYRYESPTRCVEKSVQETVRAAGHGGRGNSSSAAPAASVPVSYPAQHGKVAPRARRGGNQAENDANAKGNKRARRSVVDSGTDDSRLSRAYYPAQNAAEDQKALADNGEHRVSQPGVYVVDTVPMLSLSDNSIKPLPQQEARL